MNIKNWFKSPEGPMDLEAEVRKLRKKKCLNEATYTEKGTEKT